MKTKILSFSLYFLFFCLPFTSFAETTPIQFEYNEHAATSFFSKDNIIKIADYIVISALLIALILVIKDMVIEHKFKKNIINWFLAVIVWEVLKQIFLIL